MSEGTLINPKNAMIEELKSRIAAGSRCLYSLGQICRSRAVSNAVEIKMCIMVVNTVVVFRDAAWAVSEMDINRPGTWERRM
jgi:hypothetical protein